MKDITLLYGDSISNYAHADDLIFEGGTIFDEKGLRIATNYGIMNEESGMTDKQRTLHRKERRRKKYG